MCDVEIVFWDKFDNSEWVADVQFENMLDRVFRNLDYHDAKAGAQIKKRFGAVVGKRADTGLVMDRFFFWVLTGKDSPLGANRSMPIVVEVVDLYRRKLAGKVVTAKQWAEVSRMAYGVANDLYERGGAGYSAATVAACVAGKDVTTGVTGHDDRIEYVCYDAVDEAHFCGMFDDDDDHRGAVLAKRIADRFISEIEAHVI